MLKFKSLLVLSYIASITQAGAMHTKSSKKFVTLAPAHLCTQKFSARAARLKFRTFADAPNSRTWLT